MKIRIGYGLGTAGMTTDPNNGAERYARFIDDLERLKFDSVWFSERINGAAPDPVVAMAFAAGRTTKLKFGMSVMVLPGRNPVLVAKELASLDVLSHGRLLPAFGLGVADPKEQGAFGVTREDRAPMFNEALGLIRRLWTEDHVSHEGRFFHFNDVSVRPKPKQSPPEIWLGGFAPSELRRVGRLADGWLPSFITPAESSGLANQVRAAAAEADREIDPEHFGVLIPYSSGKPLAGSIVERFRGRRPDVTDPSELFPVGINALRAQINGFVESGYSKFVLIPVMEPDDYTEELELLAAEILPMEN
jgi:probable F420-dependent oxidoreductase